MSRAPVPNSSSGDTPMPSSFDQDLEFWEEGRLQKLTRRLKEEPLIPVGLGLTCYALYGAARSIRKGNKTTTNAYFRARVYAQSFTLLCLVVGSIYWKEEREQRKYYQGLLGEKKALEKREAWIKELEARDREEELEREKRRKRKEAKLAAQASEASAQKQTQSPQSDGPASAIETADLRNMVVGSKILGPALWLWRSKEDD